MNGRRQTQFLYNIGMESVHTPLTQNKRKCAITSLMGHYGYKIEFSSPMGIRVFEMSTCVSSYEKGTPHRCKRLYRSSRIQNFPNLTKAQHAPLSYHVYCFTPLEKLFRRFELERGIGRKRRLLQVICPKKLVIRLIYLNDLKLYSYYDNDGKFVNKMKYYHIYK